MCIAILGVLLTQCGKPRPEEKETPPVQTEEPAAPLAISRTAASAAVGETVVLSVSGGFDTLIWTSSDEAVRLCHNITY